MMESYFDYFGYQPNAALQIAPQHFIGGKYPTFIIANIGHNHQGDIAYAQRLIQIASECGADCVRFQKSDIPSTFTTEVINSPYPNRNAFGNTYGSHRQKMEFSEEQFRLLQQYAEDNNILFAASGTDEVSYDFLNSIDIPFFKISSIDCCNISLVSHVASFGKPLIISTGMTDLTSVCNLYEEIGPINNNIAFLHCLNCYPAIPHEINLNVIKAYKRLFPYCVIGYSGHEKGIGISIAAVALGAKIIERNLTLDHAGLGPEHESSLEPKEFRQLVTEIRRVEQAFGSHEKKMQECEKPCYDKLGKSIVTAEPLKRGTILKEDMLEVKVAREKGWEIIRFYDLIGRKLKKDLAAESVIHEEDIE